MAHLRRYSALKICVFALTFCPRGCQKYFLLHFVVVFDGKTSQTHRVENVQAKYVALKKQCFGHLSEVESRAPPLD